jgi:hypothetical protein
MDTAEICWRYGNGTWARRYINLLLFDCDVLEDLLLLLKAGVVGCERYNIFETGMGLDYYFV